MPGNRAKALLRPLPATEKVPLPPGKGEIQEFPLPVFANLDIFIKSLPSLFF
jgi:hypothetical protein